MIKYCTTPKLKVLKVNEEPTIEAIYDDRSSEKYYMAYFDELNL